MECSAKWNGSLRRMSSVQQVGRHVVEMVQDPDSRRVAILVDNVEVVSTTGNNYHSFRRAVIRTIERLEQAA